MMTITCRNKADPRASAAAQLQRVGQELADIRDRLRKRLPLAEVRRLSAEQNRLAQEEKGLLAEIMGLPASAAKPAPRPGPVFSREALVAAIRLWVDEDDLEPSEDEVEAMRAAIMVALRHGTGARA